MSDKEELAHAIVTKPGVFAPTAPPELSLYWRCQGYNSLPAPGGMDEQDEALMRRMATMANVYEAVKAYLAAIVPETRPVTPLRGGAARESKFTRWYNNPRNVGQVSIVNTLITKGVMSKQGKLL